MAKIGYGALGAAWRQGLKELANAFNPSKDSIAVEPELGGVATVTPGEVDRARKGDQQPAQGTVSMDTVRAEAKERANLGHGLPEAQKEVGGREV